MNFGEFKRIHFVGVGGIGMSGLAEILTNFDVAISGCDMKRSLTTERLTRSGVVVQIGHDAAHVEESDLVVTSSAVRPDNPEVLRAHEKNIPVMRRAEMLGRVMRAKKSVAVSGTHGKTSTSAMTGIDLREAGLDPTLIIGGVLRNLDTNARLGASDYLVVEADD
jgi:UDP-N-acetylmuramate--alanine ligase